MRHIDAYILFYTKDNAYIFFHRQDRKYYRVTMNNYKPLEMMTIRNDKILPDYTHFIERLCSTCQQCQLAKGTPE
jgi:hypothetical protein